MKYSIRKLFEAHLDIDKFTRDADDGGGGRDWTSQANDPRSKPVPTTGQKSAIKNTSFNNMPSEARKAWQDMYHPNDGIHGGDYWNPDNFEFEESHGKWYAEDEEGSVFGWDEIDGVWEQEKDKGRDTASLG